jgi:hypothetical protein
MKRNKDNEPDYRQAYSMYLKYIGKLSEEEIEVQMYIFDNYDELYANYIKNQEEGNN